MPAESPTQSRKLIDRSRTYVCRFACGYETNWPAARGRHESARHDGRAPASATAPVVAGTRDRKAPSKARSLPAEGKIDRLLAELTTQHAEILQALKKAALLVLAERDLRARETEQIRTDLNAIYEVLVRNRRDREQRLAALIR